MGIGTKTPHKIQVFRMLGFQNKVDWKNIYLDAKAEDKETCFYSLGFGENTF